MELQCQLLLYLDKRRYLENMKAECDLFSEMLTEKNHKFPVLRFLLQINFIDLLDASADVAMCLIQEPLKWQRMCSEILFSCLQCTTGNLAQYIQEGQCLVLVRLQGVSKSLVPTNKQAYSGLTLFEGTLISKSKPTSYVHHTVWCCPEDCEGSHVVLSFIPKTPPKCCICRSVLFENSGLRKCGEQVAAVFLLKNQSHSKTLAITDDLIPQLILGVQYLIHVVVLKELTTVWSLEAIMPLSSPLSCPVRKNIDDLYQSCDGIPWKFIYCLASSIGASFCPLNLFMHLKISLLISICSVRASLLNDSEIVHVLAAGNDTSYVGKLMTDAANIADKSIFLGTSNASVSTSLLASSGGICIMPLPLHVYNQKITHGILAAVESGEVTTDIYKTKLRSAVWAQGMDFKKIVLYNVASVFGTVCRGDNSEFRDEIADFCLERAIDPEENSKDEMQVLKELALYIDMVAGIEVTLDSSTERLLRNYFLAARKERSKSISAGSMKSLVTMCKTSARLCRRPIANIDDAVLAIWIHVSSSPEPREECLQTPADVKKLHKAMNTFKEWLEQFTGSIIFS